MDVLDRYADQEKLGLIKRHNSPFPHLILDHAIPGDVLEQINQNWPGPEVFNPEVPGNYVFQFMSKNRSMLSESQQAFWQEFYDQHFRPMIDLCFRKFSPVLNHRYGEIERLLFGHDCLVLMQAEPGQNFHAMHTHYYHDPTFVFTMLLYVDTEFHGLMGTHLYGPGPEIYADPDYLVDVARSPLGDKNWDHWEGKATSFIPNRLLAFIDGPLSFHAVKKLPAAMDPGLTVGRRIVRAHIAFPKSPFIEARYGVSWEEFRETVWETRKGDVPPQVYDWIKRDIDEHFHPDVAEKVMREGKMQTSDVRLPELYEDPQLYKADGDNGA